MSTTNELWHYGVKGMKWGVVNVKPKKVFVSGTSKMQDETSDYYRKQLPDKVSKQLDDYISNKSTILVGDAPGVDSMVQNYLASKMYKNVEVFTSNSEPRYLSDKSWKINRINPNVKLEDFNNDMEAYKKAFLRAKDIAMTKAADEGLAVILENGGAGATRNNIQRLSDMGKKIRIYLVHKYENEVLDSWVSKSKYKKM